MGKLKEFFRGSKDELRWFIKYSNLSELGVEVSYVLLDKRTEPPIRIARNLVVVSGYPEDMARRFLAAELWASRSDCYTLMQEERNRHGLKPHA